MKLRCTTDSIRIRIRRSEMETFLLQGELSDRVGFPGGEVLVFALWIHQKADFSLSFTGGNIRVGIPETEVRRWASPQQVGIEKYLALPNGQQVHLLIEKDFPCQHRTDEDKADTFQDLADRN